MDMANCHGNLTKKVTLYLPDKTTSDHENPLWLEDSDEEEIQPILTLYQALAINKNIEDDLICTFIPHPHTLSHLSFAQILENNSQENFLIAKLTQQRDDIAQLNIFSKSHAILIKIYPRKNTNIDVGLEPSQQKKPIKMLQKHRNAFAWDYNDMKGIHPNMCAHHIYIKEYS